VQGFFARALEKDYLGGADREKGRFRSFLLLALKRYMANEHARAGRQKRGGDVQLVSIDARETESRYRWEPADPMTPEKAYDRRWAETVLRRVLERLGNEFNEEGKGKTFEALKLCLDGESGGASYAEIGRPLGMSEGAVKTAVHRLRQRYRELLRSEIAETVAAPELADEEIRHLFEALG
jgi:RNA polymerase sigma-70 factor (ECF subfamily)